MEQTGDCKPSGRMSAYAFFVKETEENFKRDHPDEEINFIEFAKKCADIWRKLSDNEKEKYTRMAEEELRKFESEAPS